MAIYHYLGKPRSGKSYRVVYDWIFGAYVNDKDKKFYNYQYCYVNINGLKIDQINDNNKNRFIEEEINEDSEYLEKKIIELEWKKFYNHLEALYKMAEADQSDEELLEYARKYKLAPDIVREPNDTRGELKNLLIIDECYRYFKKSSNEVLGWLLGYHGHLYIDIVLIQQNVKQSHSEYFVHSENFILALPKSKSLSDKTFKYRHYGNSSLSKDDKYKDDKVAVRDDIFALYKSGSVHKPKKVIIPYIIYTILLFSFVIATFYYLFYSIGNRHKIDTPDETTNQNVTQHHNTTVIVQDKSVYQIRCNDRSCRLVDDKYQFYNYPLNYFKSVVIKQGLTFFHSSIDNEIYKLVPMKKGQKKIVLASLTDYYYEIDNVTKDKYLKKWFIPLKDEKPKSLFSNDEAEPLGAASGDGTA